VGENSSLCSCLLTRGYGEGEEEGGGVTGSQLLHVSKVGQRNCLSVAGLEVNDTEEEGGGVVGGQLLHAG
jgi:hypothetical protein